jgi:DNA adenine methylase
MAPFVGQTPPHVQNHTMVRPFLKWAGGKAKLAPEIVASVPPAFRAYHEPFLGAGAVFFALGNAGMVREAFLGDANSDLIACYEAVRDDTESLIDALELLAANYRSRDLAGRTALYYEQRAAVAIAPVERAARFIFLNRTCYNGLYRVNRSGQFNVPHGRYKNPRIVDAGALRATAAALAGVELRAGDFADACARAESGDFVYLDPPYQPLSPTSSFTSYTRAAFDGSGQERLRDAFEELTGRGVAAMLSNSAHPVIKDLYSGRGYTTREVPMSRSINSVGTRRSAIPEYLITNFDRPEIRDGYSGFRRELRTSVAAGG